MTGEHNTEEHDDRGMELLAHFDKGRQQAFSEVLDWIGETKEKWPASWRKNPDIMLLELESWLTKQIDAT